MTKTAEYRHEEWERRKARNPELVRSIAKRAKLKHHFGMTPEEFDVMSESQGGLCAICKNSPTNGHSRLSVDHNHEDGKIRGLLCYHCNIGLGFIEDDPLWITRARIYLSGCEYHVLGDNGAREVELTPRQRILKRHHLKKTYGMSLEDHDALVVSQNGRCAICHKPERDFSANRPWLCVDHDHLTGRVRGLLCTPCNAALGHFRDADSVLQAVWVYLMGHQSVVA